MELKIKRQIFKMLIPVIGTWWLLARIIPISSEITWWDYSRKSAPITIGLVFYQILCWVGWKVLYMMYFFDYTFEQVFMN